MNTTPHRAGLAKAPVHQSKHQPLVSIIIACRNNASAARECLESVKAQSYKNIELIVVDNFSSDGTYEIAKEYADAVYQLGPERSTQFNFGFTKSHGELIYRIGMEFVLQHDLVEKAVNKLDEGFDALALHNRSKGDSIWAKVRYYERESYQGDDSIVAVRFMKRAVFESVDGFDEALVAGEDFDLHNRIVAAGYKWNHLDAVEDHIGEPKNIREVWGKFYYYGRTIRRYQAKAGNRGRQQLAFFRPSFAKFQGELIRQPQLFFAFWFYMFIKYAAGAVGVLRGAPQQLQKATSDSGNTSNQGSPRHLEIGHGENGILICPVHYVYESALRGSEYRHAFETANIIARQFPSTVLVTGKVTENQNYSYRIIEVQKSHATYEMTFARAIVFTIKYSFVGIWLLLQKRYAVLHHIRPFNLGYTFNLPALLLPNRYKFFILGPFSSPYVSEDGSPGLAKQIITKILAKLSYSTVRRANVVVVYDEVTASMVKKIDPQANIRLLAPGVDGELFFPVDEHRAKARKIVSIGYLIPRKRFSYLISVMKYVLKQVPDAQLEIFGDGPEYKKLQKLIIQAKVETNVKLRGFVPNSDLPEIYRGADIFAMFQEEESFGQVYIEALASGLPVVTSKNVGSSLILKDSMSFLVDVDAPPSESAKYIVKLLLDNELRVSMAKKGREHFKSHYSTKAVEGRWAEIYRELH